MYQLFEPEWQWVWMVLLALALFFPVRKLIWVASVRREERRQGQATDEARRQALRRRASVTAALLSGIFSIIYVHYMFTSMLVPS